MKQDGEGIVLIMLSGLVGCVHFVASPGEVELMQEQVPTLPEKGASSFNLQCIHKLNCIL